MFKFESEMIPILVSGLSRLYRTNYFTTEFSTGNGVADLVFTTNLSDQSLIFNDYSIMSLFVNQINNKKKINKKQLYDSSVSRVKVKKLIELLELEDFLTANGEHYIQLKNYLPHTENLISIEAKLKDWKSGLYQALRYQFFSHQSFLALPEQVIHRVDKELLKSYNIGLISVSDIDVKIIITPKVTAPTDLTSYYFLSENFAKNFKSKLR